MAYLNTYNLASQALEVGNVIALGANDVQFSGCCNGLSHAAGTGIINVKAARVPSLMNGKRRLALTADPKSLTAN